MKKIIALILTMVLFCCSVTGCAYAKVETEKDEENSMFVAVEISGLWGVVYHEETKVMYAVSRGGYNGGNFTLLVNPDGSPMLWGE